MDQPSSGPPVKIVAVINSLNRLPLLREALGALTVAFRGDPLLGGAVVVYEAGSSDGSREFLETWACEHPRDRLEIVRPAPGAGTSFSDGVNDGCAAAMGRFPTAKYLLLYETDNWVAGPEPLRQACAVLEAQADLAAVGWTVRRHAGGAAGYGMRFPSLLGLAAGNNLVLRLGLDGANATPWEQTHGGVEWRRCDVVFTSPLLIRRGVWEKAGGFDAAAFPFSDCDLDWSWRCRRMGLGGQAVVRSEAVVHDNRAQASAWSDDRVVKFHRARLALLRRHRGWLGASLVKPALFLRHGLESAMLLAKRGQPGTAGKLASRLQMLRTVWRDYRAS